MAGMFNFRYKEKYLSRTCVVKYWFGSKFFIWKALHLKQSCDQVFRDLNNKIAKEKLKELSSGDLFYLVAKHINKNRPAVAIVEVLFESDDHQAILDFDRQTMQEAFKDPNCLNICCDQYIPGWLKQTASNKALQSHEIVPVVQSTATRGDIKSTPKRVASAPKLATVATGGFNHDVLKSRISPSKAGKG